MNPKTHHRLKENNLIDQNQFQYLDEIATKKRISVYYELRTLLYLGVLLFASGVGLLVYTNLGEIGHYITIILIAVVCVLCFKYVFDKEIPYSNQKTEPPTPYYDYALLLGSLLFISFQAYLHYLFNIFEGYLNWNTLFNSAILLFLAYYFDHRGLLTMAISSLASFIGISATPQEWVNQDIFEFDKMYYVGIFFSISLAVAGISLDLKKIKQHFTFSYVNFASIIYFISLFTALFSHENWKLLYLFLIIVGVAATILFANWKKSFLFLIYAFISGYIALTYIFFLIFENSDFAGMFYLWSLYTIGSCIGFMQFIKRFKNYYEK